MIAVLASGSGSNLQALINSEIRGSIKLVLSNNPGAKALERAKKAGIPTVLINHRDFEKREDFDLAVSDVLKKSGIEWVVLAGFMRIVGTPLLEAFPQRIVNIHPALLPSFPGLHGQRQAVQAGARIAGCTVHLIDAGVDTGPILAQAAIAVRQDDNEDTLSRRILELEHCLYPAVIRVLLTGALKPCPQSGWRLSNALSLPNHAPEDALFSA